MAMNEKQREFWRALVAPFPRDAYRTRPGQGGRTFTYIDARTIMNRLDDVCGPDGWQSEFTEGQRGVICIIGVAAPTPEDGMLWVRRSWGGGYKADMQSEDSAFKTGFANAFKACASLFGIGRDLYGKGMPAYCSDLFGRPPGENPESGFSREGRAEPPAARPPNGGPFNNQPPYGRTGKAPYAWSKKCGEHFGADVLGRMIAYAKKRDKPERTDQWDEGFLDECLAKTVEWLRTLATYNGEFGQARAEEAPQSAPESPPEETANLIRAAVGSVRTLVAHRTGRDANDGEIVAAIGELAAAVPNGLGHRGEVLQSLKHCKDVVWLKNIFKEANRQVEEAAKQASMDAEIPDVPDDDDIPF